MNLNDMTVSELRKLAAEYTITGRSTMKKAELVAALSAPEIVNFVELSVTVDKMDDAEATADVTPARTTVKQRRNVNVEIERDTRGGRMMYVFEEDGDMQSIRLVKRGRRWETVVDRNYSRFAVKATTLPKLVKAWAKKSGAWAAQIDITV